MEENGKEQYHKHTDSRLIEKSSRKMTWQIKNDNEKLPTVFRHKSKKYENVRAVSRICDS